MVSSSKRPKRNTSYFLGQVCLALVKAFLPHKDIIIACDTHAKLGVLTTPTTATCTIDTAVVPDPFVALDIVNLQESKAEVDAI